MNFLRATTNRLAAARQDEGGFTLIELIVCVALMPVLFWIMNSSIGGTLLPQQFTPTLAHAEHLDLKPAQQAAQRLYKDIQSFTHANPDTKPTAALLTSQGYVNEPSDVVWAFHTSTGPTGPQMCVIAYITDDTTADYTLAHPASYDSLYQSNSVWQNCQSHMNTDNTVTPNWDVQ